MQKLVSYRIKCNMCWHKGEDKVCGGDRERWTSVWTSVPKDQGRLWWRGSIRVEPGRASGFHPVRTG